MVETSFNNMQPYDQQYLHVVDIGRSTQPKKKKTCNAKLNKSGITTKLFIFLLWDLSN